MDKLKEFYERKVNVLELGEGLVLGRESTGRMDYMTICYGDEVLYAWWHDSSKKITDKKPKHTGGKKPFIKIMVEELEKRKDITIEAAGAVVKLLPYIDWNGNRIIHKRSKKALLIDDMVKVLGVGRNNAIAILKDLRDKKIIEKAGREYRLSPYLVQKGGDINGNKEKADNI